jgi:SAM-dependent methyltransferase
MRDKSVLDIGCMYGFFCFEAERRGAARVLGIDADPENVRKCRLLGDCKGSAAEFLHLDIETEEIRGQFDYVLCLNVLHRLRNPLSALDKLVAAAREVLIVEVASFTDRERGKSGIPVPLAWALRWLPVLYVGGNDRNGAAEQMFVFTRSALETILLRHRQSFAAVDFIDAGHKRRFIAKAQKRRINHLFVVAGLPTSGKSTLIDRLLSGCEPQLAQSLGFDPGKTWHDVRQFDPSWQASEAPNVILHYNISKALVHGDFYLHGRALLDLMQVSQNVTMVTLWCSPAVLLERYKQDRMNASGSRGRLRRRRKKNRELFDLYMDPKALSELYRDWFWFCRRHGARTAVVSESGSYRVTTVEELERSEPPFEMLSTQQANARFGDG